MVEATRSRDPPSAPLERGRDIGRPVVPKPTICWRKVCSFSPLGSVVLPLQSHTAPSRYPPCWNPYHSWRRAHAARPPVYSTPPLISGTAKSPFGKANRVRPRSTQLVHKVTVPPVYGVLWTFCPYSVQGRPRESGQKMRQLIGLPRSHWNKYDPFFRIPDLFRKGGPGRRGFQPKNSYDPPTSLTVASTPRRSVAQGGKCFTCRMAILKLGPRSDWHCTMELRVRACGKRGTFSTVSPVPRAMRHQEISRQSGTCSDPVIALWD